VGQGDEMSFVSGRHPAMKELCEALGIKNGISITIKGGVNKMTTVMAEFYPEEEGIRGVTAVMKKYKLRVFK
jgi:hypothetical protein